MRSAEIRSLLKGRTDMGLNTRLVHQLGLALVKERLHLDSRARRPSIDTELLWSRDGASHKVVTRSVGSITESSNFEVFSNIDPDFLILVMVRRDTFRLLGMARIAWSMVEWLGKAHGTRWRLYWGENTPVRGVAEML